MAYYSQYHVERAANKTYFDILLVQNKLFYEEKNQQVEEETCQL